MWRVRTALFCTKQPLHKLQNSLYKPQNSPQCNRFPLWQKTAQNGSNTALKLNHEHQTASIFLLRSAHSYMRRRHLLTILMWCIMLVCQSANYVYRGALYGDGQATAHCVKFCSNLVGGALFIWSAQALQQLAHQ